MDERDKLITQLIKEKGGSREDYLRLLDSIAYHESAHTLDPTIQQEGGGPGRGVYQFEEGKNAGGITAARRTKQYYDELNLPVPKWLEEVNTLESLDATQLTKEQQDALFLGNMRKHPKANFKDVWEGKESIKDFWLNYHWAGPDSQRKERARSFDNSMRDYNQNYLSTRPKSINQTKPKNVRPTSPAPITPPNVSSELPGRRVANASDFWNNLNSTVQNQNAMGNTGMLGKYDKDVNIFGNGGTHSQNPIGGIPLGMGSNGKLNTVEEDEVAFNFTDDKILLNNPYVKKGKTIFSNRKLNI